MGVDFIGAVMAMPAHEEPDWEAGRRAIEHLASAPMRAWPTDFRDLFADELGDDTHVDAARLRRDFGRVRDHWENGGRESGRFSILGVHLLVTGGMSDGDPPTDLVDSIGRLDAAGVLEACGFNRRESTRRDNSGA